MKQISAGAVTVLNEVLLSFLQNMSEVSMRDHILSVYFKILLEDFTWKVETPVSEAIF